MPEDVAKRFKKKATENAREEIGAGRVKVVEEWVEGVEGLDKGLTLDGVPTWIWVPQTREFFLLFDALRLRGVDKTQAARTAQQLVAPVAPIHVKERE